MAVKIKRIYESATADDGYRVLVDRLWPRGVSKDKAKLDEWLKDIGPSNELRQWFNHDPVKYPEFKQKYEKEIAANPLLKSLQEIIKSHQTVTLLYSAHDSEHNQAVVLQAYLAKK